MSQQSAASLMHSWSCGWTPIQQFEHQLPIALVLLCSLGIAAHEPVLHFSVLFSWKRISRSEQDLALPAAEYNGVTGGHPAGEQQNDNGLQVEKLAGLVVTELLKVRTTGLKIWQKCLKTKHTFYNRVFSQIKLSEVSSVKIHLCAKM